MDDHCVHCGETSNNSTCCILKKVLKRLDHPHVASWLHIRQLLHLESLRGLDDSVRHRVWNFLRCGSLKTLKMSSVSGEMGIRMSECHDISLEISNV